MAQKNKAKKAEKKAIKKTKAASKKSGKGAAKGKKSGGKKGKVAIIVATSLLVLGGGGFAAYYFLFNKKNDFVPCKVSFRLELYGTTSGQHCAPSEWAGQSHESGQYMLWWAGYQSYEKKPGGNDIIMYSNVHYITRVEFSTSNGTVNPSGDTYMVSIPSNPNSDCIVTVRPTSKLWVEDITWTIVFYDETYSV